MKFRDWVIMCALLLAMALSLIAAAFVVVALSTSPQIERCEKLGGFWQYEDAIAVSCWTQDGRRIKL